VDALFLGEGIGSVDMSVTCPGIFGPVIT
jgi:hypothetical protein